MNSSNIIAKNNERCLEIVNMIRDGYDKLQNVLENDEVNVIGVFILELIRHGTNTALNDDPKITNDLLDRITKAVDAKKIADGHPRSTIRLNKLSQIVNKIYRFYPRTKVGFAHNPVALSFRKFILKYPYQFSYLMVDNAKLYLRRKDLQYSHLGQLLNDMSKLLNRSEESFCQRFIAYTEEFITLKPVSINWDIYISGNNGDVTARLNSAMTLAAGKPVISSSHGDQSSFFIDEPYCGLVEISYASTYLTYGSHVKPMDCESQRPLKPFSPKIGYISSNIGKSLYQGKEVIYRPLSDTLKVLYTPTCFSRTFRYGPYRDVDDLDYLRFQSALLKFLPNTTLKPHPESGIYFDELRPYKWDERIFQSAMVDYELYIFDYVSTALAFAMCTNKPIIYFDLGIRKLTADAEERMKSRVFWYEVDIYSEIEPQIRKGIEEYQSKIHQFKNEYSERYSINLDAPDDLKTLKETIEDSLQNHNRISVLAPVNA